MVSGVEKTVRVTISFGIAILFSAAAVAADAPPLPIPKPDFSVVLAAAPLPPPLPGLEPEEGAPVVLAAVQPGERPETRTGVSGLPVPRFVSLKSGEVYLREGPSSEHKVQWVYVRRGLPVEVIAEYDVWRRIRDADGVTGWVHKQMLDGRRSLLVMGSANVPLHELPRTDGAVVAYVEPGVVARLKRCETRFCEVEAGQVDAYIDRDRVWGVYAGETVE